MRSLRDYSTYSRIAKVLFVVVLTLQLSGICFGQVDSPKPFTVVLDAGHGGRDPGCLGKNSKEKDLALDVTLLVGKKVRALYPQINVLYTRKTDVFIPLKRRAGIANDAQADLFLSIHCNYAPNKPHVVGTETFVMGLHKQASNLEVVKRENSVIEFEDEQQSYADLDPNSPIGHIILQARQDANLEQSIEVASYIQDQFTHKLKRNNRGVKQAGFLVLYQTTMPSALIELGFLSNKEEEAYCMSDDGQNELANAITKAIGQYIQSMNPEIEPAIQAKTEVIYQPESKDLPIRYRIQLAASSRNTLASDNQLWSNIDDFEIVAEQGMYKYITGNYRSLSAAREENKRLKQKGFRDAFVVAYQGTTRVVLEH